MEIIANARARLVTQLALAAILGGGVVGCQSHSAAVTAVICTMPHDELAAASGNVTPGHADLSGSTRLGKASYYARSFAYRLMANGRKMDPQGDNAASRTLPLGSTAKVINVQTGQSAIVTIQDRGPYVKGRVLDLSPATARRIGITRKVGVAEVKIAPISVKLPDGSMKAGDGAPKPPICRATAT